MTGAPIPWAEWCASGALLAIWPDDDTDDCPAKGCDRPRKHSGRHNGQPARRPKSVRKTKDWKFG